MPAPFWSVRALTNGGSGTHRLPPPPTGPRSLRPQDAHSQRAGLSRPASERPEARTERRPTIASPSARLGILGEGTTKPIPDLNVVTQPLEFLGRGLNIRVAELAFRSLETRIAY